MLLWSCWPNLYRYHTFTAQAQWQHSNRVMSCRWISESVVWNHLKVEMQIRFHHRLRELYIGCLKPFHIGEQSVTMRCAPSSLSPIFSTREPYTLCISAIVYTRLRGFLLCFWTPFGNFWIRPLCGRNAQRTVMLKLHCTRNCRYVLSSKMARSDLIHHK